MFYTIPTHHTQVAERRRIRPSQPKPPVQECVFEGFHYWCHQHDWFYPLVVAARSSQFALLNKAHAEQRRVCGEWSSKSKAHSSTTCHCRRWLAS